MTSLRSLGTLALVAFALGLTGCGLFGATFGFPSEPPVPPGASVVEEAEGQNDDDPMRGRQTVIDTAGAPPEDLVAYYREQFPTTEGWVDGKPDPDVGGGHLLCLVNNADDEFDEYVEIYERSTGSEYLVSVSRLDVHDENDRTINRCGLAGNWYPIQ